MTEDELKDIEARWDALPFGLIPYGPARESIRDLANALRVAWARNRELEPKAAFWYTHFGGTPEGPSGVTISYAPGTGERAPEDKG